MHRVPRDGSKVGYKVPVLGNIQSTIDKPYPKLRVVEVNLR